MEIQIATEQDLPDLLAIQYETQDLHVQLEPAVYRAASDVQFSESLRQLLAEGESVVWIARVDGEAAGFLLFKILAVPETPFAFARRDGLIDQLAVAARFRRRGVGRALVVEAERYAVGQGCRELRLAVLVANRAARDFYAAADFEPFLERWRKQL